MSAAATVDDAVPKPPSHYVDRADAGDVTWLEDAIEDYLGLTVTGPQREICRSVAANHQTLVITANGLGKSYILAAITIVWITVRYPAVSFATSGTERKMKRTYCKPVENLHDNARIPLPGEYKSRPERIEIDGEPEHFFEAASPKDAGELEGVHSSYTLAIIEEADKDDVDEEVLEAMDSLAVDKQDRTIAIANPPKDETNSIYPLIDDPEWNVLEFSSFDSHNVQVEMGTADGEMVDGLATAFKIEKDWKKYNKEPWPGLEEARRVSAPKLDEDGSPSFASDPTLRDNPDFREDLDVRWYRRRAGITPPGGAGVPRPIELSAVEAAWERAQQRRRVLVPTDSPEATGIDVARSGGDTTPAASVYGDIMLILHEGRGDDHTVQEDELRDVYDDCEPHPMAIDAVGEGSGLADRLCLAYPDMMRYNAGSVPEDDTEYANCWTEGLALLGKWLEAGGVIFDRTLYEQLAVAARVVEYDTTHIASRGTNGEDVFRATPKDKVKERLGHSPDYLDAAQMALWARDSGAGTIGTGSLDLDEPDPDADPDDQAFEDSELGQAAMELAERHGGFR